MKGHRWFAATYDLLMRPGDSVLAPVRQFVAGGASGLVLEVGCGTGANLPYYDWERIESLDATEPDPFMLQRARRRASKLPPSSRLVRSSRECPSLTRASACAWVRRGKSRS